MNEASPYVSHVWQIQVHFEGKNTSQDYGWAPSGEQIIRIQSEKLSTHYSVSCIVSTFDFVPTFCDYHKFKWSGKNICINDWFFWKIISGTLFAKQLQPSIYDLGIF